MPEMRAASPLPVKILSLLLLAFGSLALWVPRLPRDLRLKRKAEQILAERDGRGQLGLEDLETAAKAAEIIL